MLLAQAAILLYAPEACSRIRTASRRTSSSAMSRRRLKAIPSALLGGVATVVTKLLLQSPPTPHSGKKDYQQLQVIKRMTRDLDIPVAIEGCATVREHDGLAMSSRNAYLSADERRVAARLNLIMHDAIKAVRANEPIAAAEAEASRHVLAAGFASVDYIAIRDAETLAPISDLARPARILAAAWLGKTRLIDNMAV
jgi:pantoate--beta-alanine ligase